jgi:phosphoglycolate phosphatase
MNAPAKFIVWDWNGTLLDDAPIVHSFVNATFKHFGREPMDIETFRVHSEAPIENFYRKLGFTEPQIQMIFNGEDNFVRTHYEPVVDTTELRHGAKEVLRDMQAQGVQSLILSNHIINPIRRHLKRLEAESYIVEVIAYPDYGAEHRGEAKGDKLRRFMAGQSKPQSAVIIGDTIEEIEIARDQGLISVAVAGGYTDADRLRAARPDLLVHSLHELKPILQERGFVS